MSARQARLVWRESLPDGRGLVLREYVRELMQNLRLKLGRKVRDDDVDGGLRLDTRLLLL